MPKYMCPECQAVLKRSDPIPSGKKIKCPKCETVFAAKAIDENDDEKPKKSTTKSKPKPAAVVAQVADDEEDMSGYGVAQKPGEEEEDPKVHYGSLRDKFPKSKRGPALARTVKPSNMLLLEGFLICIGAVVWFLISMWPLVFDEGKPLPSEAQKTQYMYMGFAVGVFLYGCLVCYAASQFQSLESYPWAMVGCLMAIFPAGILGLMVLSDKEVKAGFAETKATRKERSIKFQ